MGDPSESPRPPLSPGLRRGPPLVGPHGPQVGMGARLRSLWHRWASDGTKESVTQQPLNATDQRSCHHPVDLQHTNSCNLSSPAGRTSLRTHKHWGIVTVVRDGGQTWCTKRKKYLFTGEVQNCIYAVPRAWVESIQSYTTAKTGIAPTLGYAYSTPLEAGIATWNAGPVTYFLSKEFAP